MNLKQLKAFIAVADEQSFSKAAASTHLSQPTLSRLLKQLEDELEVDLIDRYHRPLLLTEAGQFFYDKLSNLLHELETVTHLTRQIGQPSSALNVGFVPSVLYGLLPEIIAALKKQHPQLDVALKDISSYQQINALKKGEIDVGFGRFSHQDIDIKQVLLRHERYVVALPVWHTLVHQEELHLAQVVDQALILYHQTHLPKTEATTVTEPLLHLFAQHGLTPLNTTTVSDVQVALGLVAAGEGMTLVPDSLKNVRNNQIAYIRLAHEDATTPIYLHTLSTQHNPHVTTLLKKAYQVYEAHGITYRPRSIGSS